MFSSQKPSHRTISTHIKKDKWLTSKTVLIDDCNHYCRNFSSNEPKLSNILIIVSLLFVSTICNKLSVPTHAHSPEEASARLTAATNTNEQSARSLSSWSLPNRPSLFNIIRFPNEECFDSSNQSGTCYTAFECKLIGGQPSSPCAAGFGSCCIVSRTCHVTTREKVVYFKNPSYPSADSEERFCDLTITIDDPNVCQIRIDFLDFQLDQPTNGACNDDYLEISASGLSPQTVPRLCGLNRNQHCKLNILVVFPLTD